MLALDTSGTSAREKLIGYVSSIRYALDGQPGNFDVVGVPYDYQPSDSSTPRMNCVRPAAKAKLAAQRLVALNQPTIDGYNKLVRDVFDPTRAALYTLQPRVLSNDINKRRAAATDIGDENHCETATWLGSVDYVHSITSAAIGTSPPKTSTSTTTSTSTRPPTTTSTPSAPSIYIKPEVKHSKWFWPVIIGGAVLATGAGGYVIYRRKQTRGAFAGHARSRSHPRRHSNLGINNIEIERVARDADDAGFPDEAKLIRSKELSPYRLLPVIAKTRGQSPSIRKYKQFTEFDETCQPMTRRTRPAFCELTNAHRMSDGSVLATVKSEPYGGHDRTRTTWLLHFLNVQDFHGRLLDTPRVADYRHFDQRRGPRGRREV